MQYTFPLLQNRFHSPTLKEKNPRFRGEYVLLMHYTGSSPAGEHRDRGRVERCRTSQTYHPTHFRAPLRHEGRDPETMRACRMTRVKTCMARTAGSWPT